MAFARHGDPVTLGGRLAVNRHFAFRDQKIGLAGDGMFQPVTLGKCASENPCVLVDLKRRAAITRDQDDVGLSLWIDGLVLIYRARCLPGTSMIRISASLSAARLAWLSPDMATPSPLVAALPLTVTLPSETRR